MFCCADKPLRGLARLNDGDEVVFMFAAPAQAAAEAAGVELAAAEEHYLRRMEGMDRARRLELVHPATSACSDAVLRRLFVRCFPGGEGSS